MSRTVHARSFLGLMIGFLVALPLVVLNLFPASQQAKAQVVPPPGGWPPCSGYYKGSTGPCTQSADCLRADGTCSSKITVMELPMLTKGVPADNWVLLSATTPCAYQYLCVKNTRGVCQPNDAFYYVYTNTMQFGGACTLPPVIPPV